MKTETMRDTRHDGLSLLTQVSAAESAMLSKEIISEVIRQVAAAIAEQFLADHANDILAKLDPQAIANLAIADSGRAVREALEKQIPREVQHHHHTHREFFKVGLFGSVKRV